MSSSSTETLVDVTMPQMGVSVAEGTVVEWKKQVGDWVEADEIIASISTDKIDTDVESPATGRVQEILVEVGDDRRRRHRDGADRHRRQARRGARVRERRRHRRGRRPRSRRRARPASCRRHDASPPDRPAARRGAARPAALLAGGHADRRRARHRPRAGRGHRPRRARAQAGRARVPRDGDGAAEEPPMHIESPYRPDEPAPREDAQAAPQRVEEAPRGRPRRRRCRPAASRSRACASRSAARMVQSLQTAATCTTIVEADMTRIEAARKAAGLTLPALPSRARRSRRCASSRRSTPRSRATTYTDLRRRAPRHRGLARRGRPDRPGHPRRAGPLASRAWPSAIKDLAARARDNQLTPDEVRGGTFTITNPGGYGSIMATPVINQPQVGDPRHRGRRQAPGGDHRRARQRLDRDPPMTYLCMSLGPPRARRRARRAVPDRAAQEVGEPGRSTRPQV